MIQIGGEDFFETEEGKKIKKIIQEIDREDIVYWHQRDRFGGDTIIIRKTPNHESIKQTLLKGFESHAKTQRQKERLKEIVENIFVRQPPFGLLGTFTSALEDIMQTNLSKEIECSVIEFAAPIYEALGLPFKEVNHYGTKLDRVFDEKGKIVKEAETRRVIVRELRLGVVEKRIEGKKGNIAGFNKADFCAAVRSTEKPTREAIARYLRCGTRRLQEWCKENFPSSEGQHFKRAVEECKQAEPTTVRYSV